MTKAELLAQVVEWLHNDAAGARAEEFWARAMDAIAGDVYGVDSSAAGWDTAHCAAHGSLWFYAALYAGHVWTRDAAGQAGASQCYRDEVTRCGTAPALRGATGQVRRSYGA